MIIYKTTNLINNKWYIGQDSKNLPYYLGGGILLLKAIKKYGKENFKKEILQELPPNSTKKDLNKAEIYWINKTNAIIDENSYNLALGGDDISRNPEVKNKISIKLIGNKNGIGKRPNNSGDKWKGKRGSEHYLFGKVSPKKGLKMPKEFVLKNALSHGAKPFLILDKNNKIVKEYLILSQCAKEMNLQRSCIFECLIGKRKTHKGYIFRYKG